MQQSGRLKEHHAPQSVRQNFFRKQTTKDLNKVEPTYIVNYDDLPYVKCWIASVNYNLISVLKFIGVRTIYLLTMPF